MSDNVQMSIQVDAALFDRLDAYALEHHIKSRGQLVSRILWIFFRSLDLRKEAMKEID